MKQNLKWVAGSLHSHGLWTDYRNRHERFLAPFDIEHFANICISNERTFQAITDIMAHWPNKPEFKEQRYKNLIETANPNSTEHSLDIFPHETRVNFSNGNEFWIPRTQEILTDTPRKHILGLNLGKSISGGRDSLEILKEIKGEGGYAIIDHPFSCQAWTKEELVELYQNELIVALEWNGGLTVPSWFPKWFDKIGPTKRDNKKVLKLENQIPIIANDDSRCVQDIKRGAYTEYLTEENGKSLTKRIVQSIQNGEEYFNRHEQYSRWDSIWTHVLNGRISMWTKGKYGLPDA